MSLNSDVDLGGWMGGGRDSFGMIIKNLFHDLYHV